MRSPERQLAELEFLIRIQRILGEGLFVASYKYALADTWRALNLGPEESSAVIRQLGA